MRNHSGSPPRRPLGSAIVPPKAARFRYCPPEGRSVPLLSATLKYAGILAYDDFLSSLLSLLSFFCTSPSALLRAGQAVASCNPLIFIVTVCVLASLCALSVRVSLLSLLSLSHCLLPSDLAAAHVSTPSSLLSLRTSHQVIHSDSNPHCPVPHHTWPGGMREAIKFAA